jgi:hypothetical protein
VEVERRRRRLREDGGIKTDEGRQETDLLEQGAICIDDLLASALAETLDSR